MAEQRWAFPTVVEGMTLDDIVDYAAGEHDQTIAKETLRRFHAKGSNGFPAPAAVFARRPVWARSDIDRWLATRRRTPGPVPAEPAPAADRLRALRESDPDAYAELLEAARAEAQ